MFDWKGLPKKDQIKPGIESGSKTQRCGYCGDGITLYVDNTVTGSNEKISSGWQVDLSKGLPDTCMGRDCPLARVIRERG